MAACPVCGRKLAFRGRTAVKNHLATLELTAKLESVRARLVEVMEDHDSRDQASLTLLGEFDRKIEQGKRFAPLFHEVAHDAAKPYVPYPEMIQWKAEATYLIERLIRGH